MDRGKCNGRVIMW